MNSARLLGIAAACVLAGSSAEARDLKTVGGTVFKNISLVSKSATGIQVSHDDGLIFLDFRNLNEADRKEFGYEETAYVEGLKQNLEVEKQRRAQALAAQQARQARARAEAADANAWKTYSYNGPQPPYVPTPQTGLQYTIDTPGYGYGPYSYPGTSYPMVPQTYYGNGTVPYIRNPYPYYGPTMGPVIIRRR